MSSSLSLFSICLNNLVLGSFVFITATEGSLVVMGTQLLLSEFFLNKIVKRLGWILFCVAITTVLRGSVCSGEECWNNSCRRPDFPHCQCPVERMLTKSRVPKALSVISPESRTDLLSATV